MIVIDVSRFRKGLCVVAGLLMLAAIMLLTYRAVETSAPIVTNEVKYKNYKGLNGTFSYKLPSEWKTVEQNFGGNEIIYHNGFVSRDNKMHGYVEVWNLNMPLINFIRQSQKSAVGIVSFKYYTIEPIRIQGKDGYLLQYSRRDDKNKYLKAFEVFIIEKDSTVCRFAFYMDEPVWKDEYRTFFLNIAATAKLE